MFTEEFIKISKKSLVKCKIAVAMEKSYQTIEIWLTNPNQQQNFTTKKGISALVESTGLTEDQIFTKD